MRVIMTAALALWAATTTLPASRLNVARGQDAAATLAASRAALGGDALLNSITSVTVSGSATEDIGRVSLSKSVEINLELPDKFVVMKRHHSYGPPGMGMDFTVTVYEGFNGGTPLDAHLAPGAPIAPFPSRPAPKTPDEIKAAADRRMRLNREAFVRMMLPLFAGSPAAVPLQFESSGQVTIEKTLADVISAKTADGSSLRLYLDAATHLPLKLTWMADPIVTFSTSSIVTTTVTTSSRGGTVMTPPQLPPSSPMPTPPPVGNLTPVEWATTFSDYKTEAGLTWPRRFVTTMGGKKQEDMRLGKYKINVPIKPQVFEPKK